MTDPNEPVQPRPQPEHVVNAVSVGGTIGALVAAGGMYFVFFGLASSARVQEFSRITAVFVTAAVAAIVFLAPYVGALHARNKVTPITPKAIPRDAYGRRLIPAEEYGRHAKKTPPPAPPSTVQRSLEHLRDRYGPDPDDDRDVEEFVQQIRTSKEQPRVTTRRPLGRKPPTNAPRIKLTARMVPAAAFTPPASVDWYTKVPTSSWGMDGNDTVGDCTCAEVDHSAKARQVAAGNPEVRSTAAEVLALYSAVTGYNPNNPNSDQGAVMQDVRDFWRKRGVILGGKLDKVTLFAQVDHTDHTLIKWCIARFGAIGVGFNFPDFAMTQFDEGKPWDVVKDAPKPTEGHAVSAAGYDDTYVYTLSWGQVQKMTWAFWDAYVEEAWADLSADWINTSSGQDPLGEVAYTLGEQFAQVTGKPNPFPAPAPEPAPTPAPSPAPAPEPAPDMVAVPAALAAEVTAWSKRALARVDDSHQDKKTAKDWTDFEASQ